MFKIHKEFCGGNISVVSQTETEVVLENELRDTGDSITDWFYWAFCIEGAENKEITFHMQRHRLGHWGPAVSYDLENWFWLNSCDGDSFTYHFSSTESKVYFAHHILYATRRFFDLAKRYNLSVEELCTSKRERSVPCVKFGKGTQSIVLTGRHHACESAGSYVLEGVLNELLSSPLPDVSIFCVPFVDYDGVLDGDQGKGRAPHDHNRDYIDTPVHPETSAIKKYVEQHGCNFAFDFHSPWHKGGENDTIFIVRNRTDRSDVYDKFATILESQCTPETMTYRIENDHPACTGWNQPSANFSYMMHCRPECKLSFSLENTYFGSEDNKVSAERLIALGKAFARALKQFLTETL